VKLPDKSSVKDRELLEWHRADYDAYKVAEAKAKGLPYPEPIMVVMGRRAQK
jgi:hypothetical protein